ncbi:unnamed protein product [Caenorhabditis auriculariae]|uniref:LITAF domain-containing protein n=1 Tax=Caenorhabditis auriculariae TaxID=2777116 RepID=A0A8S1GPB8_9PELO|nr:unnamed protein product [Caenorhabditis auriculariae]
MSESSPPPEYQEKAPEQPVTVQPVEAPTANGNDHPRHFVSARTSAYGSVPIEMDCPHCQNHIVSHIDKVAGVLPWVMALALAVAGIFLFLIPWLFCCVPFCTDRCLDVIHTCPACKRSLGRLNRM